MSKIFEIDFRKGSYISSTNHTPTITGIPKFLKLLKGYGLKSNALGNALSYPITTLLSQIGMGEFSFVVAGHYVKTKSVIQIRYLCGWNFGPGFAFGINENNDKINWYLNYGGGAFSDKSIIPNRDFLIVGKKIINGANEEAWVSVNNSNFYRVRTQANTTVNNNYPFTVFAGNGFGGNNRAVNTPIYQIQVYNHALSQSEVNTLYQDFLTWKPSANNKFNFFYYKPTLISENGLIVSYNFEPVGNVLTNIAWNNSANNYNAAQANIIFKGQNLNDGIILRKKSINVPTILQNIGKVYTICFRSKIINGSSYFLYREGNSVLSHNTSTINSTELGLSWTASDNINILNNIFNDIVMTRDNTIVTIFVNGVKKTTKIATNNNDTIITSFNFNGETLDSNTILNDVRFYNRVISDKEIGEYHNKYAFQLIFKEDFSDYPVRITGSLPNCITKVINSSFNVQIFEEISNNLKLDFGKKYGNFKGVYTFYNTYVAYGTFSFKYKLTTFSEYWVTFITGSYRVTDRLPLGYTFSWSFIGGNNNIKIWRDSGSPILLDTGIIPVLGQWYDVKIERYKNGLFIVYIDDFLIGQFTDTTYTSSKGFSVRNSVGGNLSGIADIKITQGIII